MRKKLEKQAVKKQMKNQAKTEEFERCILCGALTDIPISMPIDMRDNYEIGVGQICERCARVRRGEPSDAQILAAVEKSKEN